MKFKDFPYQRPDGEAVLSQLDRLTQAFAQAKTFPEQLALYQEREALEKELNTMSSLSHVRFSINTRDQFYKAECDFFDSWGPLLQEKDQQFTQALLDSPFLPEFKKELGQVPLQNMELALNSFGSEVVALKQEENELETQYQTLYAGAMVEFDGKTMPLPLLGPYKISPDRDIRKAAYQVEGQFFDEHQGELDDIFDRLVTNRTKQAHILGYEDYVALAYDRRTRNCYNAQDVARYRQQILEEIVPLVAEIKEHQKKRIGLTEFRFYDDPFLFPDGNPTPKGSPEELLAFCQQMYQEMSPETGKFIDFMFEKELFDVVSRDGKAPGGFCTTFPSYEAPFIFSNFNGTSGDVDVLTHEAGHALAAYFALELPYLCQQYPTYDACEVHSMAMEYLTAPWHHLFFQEDSKKYHVNQAEGDLAFLPYGTMVDYFQELVYQNPDWSPAQRNDCWATLEKQFRPYLNMEGLPFYGRGAGWQRQIHIYQVPFYYIDYCLASTVALQIQALALKDREKAWETYLNYTKRSGTQNFLDLVTGAGLDSPMEEGCLKSISTVISEWWREMENIR